MQIKELEDICVKIRSGLDNFKIYKPEGCFELLSEFPIGCCKISSFIVMYCLSEYLKLPKTDLSLLANAEIGNASHAWAKYKNVNIDLTADQFKDLNMPKVIVSMVNPWQGIDYSIFPYHKEDFSPSWYEMLVNSCEFIRSNQLIDGVKT